MTDTSREAVEAVAAGLRDFAKSDRNAECCAADHFATEAADTLAALLEERDALKAERDAALARAEVAERLVEEYQSSAVMTGIRDDRLKEAQAEVARLRERIGAAAELADAAFHSPQGTLWNYGTAPTALDRAKWEGVRETAQDILGVLDPDRTRAALGEPQP